MQHLEDPLLKEKEMGNLNLRRKCDVPMITHLKFEDDVFIFYRGEAGTVGSVKKVLHHFAATIGLHLNLKKS